MPPLVSIVIPVWNQALELRVALASVLAQSLDDWECWVVDDGSEDDCEDMVRRTGDSRFEYLRLQRNQGRGAARQTGLERCRGRYVGSLDADDWWYPWKLDQQVKLLDKSPEIGAISSSLAVEEVAGEVRGVWRVTAPGSIGTLPPITSALEVRVSHGATLMHRSIALEVGYDSRLRRAEDRLFLMHVLSRAPHCVLGDPLYAYRPSRLASRFDLSARYWWRARAYSRAFLRFPLSAPIGCVQSVIQAGLALALGFAGVSRQLTPRKPQPPVTQEIERHRKAWTEVQAVERGSVRA